jgi:signal transduction histidine kinase
MAFTIDSWFWQATGVLIGGLVCIAAGGYLLYRWRVHRIEEQLNARFEERLSERTRIAQELHDTLLQGFLSASMQIEIATEMVSDESPAKPRFVRAVTLMRQVIEEGRNAIRGLRSPIDNALNLEHAFAQIQQEFEAGSSREARFRVTVTGEPELLQPVLRDELYRIGREALVNAFRHSQATVIEISITYSPRYFCMVVCDNGRGIDPAMLRGEAHWGLTGMQERASHIGASLKVLSRPSAGTEVQLKVPAKLAYRSAARASDTTFV